MNRDINRELRQVGDEAALIGKALRRSKRVPVRDMLDSWHDNEMWDYVDVEELNR